jgi:hypothetical protein
MATEKQLTANRWNNQSALRHCLPAQLLETKGAPGQNRFVLPNPEIHESGCEIITEGAIR